ncbi:PaaI family thioesterase [Deinococcus roseus]|uniref:DUF4442 domain-containing protein n=1 Tax=Deinococcus roseus TaxID=392414 RepID=A0ABQ2CZA2_9DEIO|nr:YiiD C-terminal domain-containing protein [Deinococcus roseus]GGJ30962.1 hypothetical protein GCM10008938_16320 [Deinococcus roseus]
MQTEMLNQMLATVPFNGWMNVQVTGLQKGAATCTLEPRRELLNHIGTLHAAVQFGLAESACGAAIASSLPGGLLAYTPLITRVDFQYLAALKGKGTARAQIAEDALENLLSELEVAGRTRVNVQVEVTGEDGVVAAAGTLEWYVRKNQN